MQGCGWNVGSIGIMFVLTFVDSKVLDIVVGRALILGDWSQSE